MLLKFIRKHLKIIFIFVLTFMIVPFLFWGMSSYVKERSQEEKVEYRLGGKRVSKAKLRQAYMDSRTQLIINFIEANNISAEQFGMYQNWLNQLLQRTDFNRLAFQQLLLQKEARSYGLLTTRKEIASWLEKFLLFQRNGQFDIETYQGLVTNLFNTWPAQFEESLTRILTIKKLQALILNSVLASTNETYQVYKERNEKVVVYYTEFDSINYMDKVGALGKKDLEDYYNKHKEEFREPEKIKIAYLLFDPETLKQEIEIGPKEIEDYYKANYKEEKLDEVKDQIKEKLTKQKAEELNQERALEASIQLTEEKRLGDMHRLAEQKKLTLSESKFISKNEFIPEIGWAPQIVQTVWEMDLETISDLIRAGSKWVIASPIERKPSQIPELSTVKAQVTERLKKEKAEELAYKDALETLARLPKELPFTMALKSLGLKITKSKPLTRTHPLGKAAFEKQPGVAERKLRAPIVSGSTLFSIRKFYPIKPEKWEKEKETFTKTYLEEKKRRFYSEWLESL